MLQKGVLNLVNDRLFIYSYVSKFYIFLVVGKVSMLHNIEVSKYDTFTEIRN